MVVRDLVMERWAYSREILHRQTQREVYYLSMEFLVGQSLERNLLVLGMESVAREVCQEFGVTLEEICELESDAGLGNGGLGRLASVLPIPWPLWAFLPTAMEFVTNTGLFKQKIVDGYQIELVDPWLEDGNLWETPAAGGGADCPLWGVT